MGAMKEMAYSNMLSKCMFLSVCVCVCEGTFDTTLSFHMQMDHFSHEQSNSMEGNCRGNWMRV